MIYIWRWVKFNIGNSIPKQRLSSDIKQRLLDDFRCFGRVINTDMYNQQSFKLSRKGVVGIPDLTMIVKDQGKKLLLVGERKGRNYHGVVRTHERNQLLLYMYIIKSLQPYPVIGRIAYNNNVIDISYDETLVNSILAKKKKCLRILNSLN